MSNTNGIGAAIANLRPTIRPRLPDGSGMGADPLDAARATGLPKRPPDEAASFEGLENGVAKAAEDAVNKKLQTNYFRRSAAVANLVEMARNHDNRTVFTEHDASVRAQIEALIHSLVGIAPPPLDPIFEVPKGTSRPINSAVDLAIRVSIQDAITGAPSEEEEGSTD